MQPGPDLWQQGTAGTERRVQCHRREVAGNREAAGLAVIPHLPRRTHALLENGKRWSSPRRATWWTTSFGSRAWKSPRRYCGNRLRRSAFDRRRCTVRVARLHSRRSATDTVGDAARTLEGRTQLPAVRRAGCADGGRPRPHVRLLPREAVRCQQGRRASLRAPAAPLRRRVARHGPVLRARARCSAPRASSWPRGCWTARGWPAPHPASPPTLGVRRRRWPCGLRLASSPTASCPQRPRSSRPAPAAKARRSPHRRSGLRHPAPATMSVVYLPCASRRCLRRGRSRRIGMEGAEDWLAQAGPLDAAPPVVSFLATLCPWCSWQLAATRRAWC